MNIDIHQTLMDSAYAKYTSELSSEAWMKLLTPSEKKAVVLGNFNYQVENGGVIQWIDNGYCMDIVDLISVLKEMNTENSKKVVKFLKKVLPKIDLEQDRIGCMGDYTFGKRLQSGKTFLKFEEEYSAMSDSFLSECEEFLKKHGHS